MGIAAVPCDAFALLALTSKVLTFKMCGRIMIIIAARPVTLDANKVGSNLLCLVCHTAHIKEVIQSVSTRSFQPERAMTLVLIHLS